jgi:integrase
MSIYRSKGSWKAEVWMDSRRITTKSGFATKELAKKWRSQTTLDLMTKPQELHAPKELLFDDLLGKYETIHLPTISPETQRRYRTDIDFRIRDFFKGRPLDSIEPMLIESFRSRIMKDLKPKSVNNCCELLRSIFRKGEEWGMVGNNPVKIRSLKLSDQKYGWWDKKEYLTRFLEAAKQDRYYAAYRLALECGLRLGEIVGLSKQDVSFERNQIHIHRQWLNREECYGPTKGRTERYVSLNPKSELRCALQEAILRSPDKECIFVTKRGVRVRPRRLAARHFQETRERSGVPRIRFHDLRHTFASWYMIEVGDIWSLKAILGHVDVQTTQRYAHLSVQNQKKAAFSWAMSK